MRIKNRNKKIEHPLNDVLAYVAGKEKAELIGYCLKKKKFYQAEAARDLHWSVSKAQYHLYRFVKHNLLKELPTATRTYYIPNVAVIKKTL